MAKKMDETLTCPNCGWIGVPRRFESVETEDDAQGCFVLLQCLGDCNAAFDKDDWSKP